MKFGIIVFPGSNCDDDMVYLLREQLSAQVDKVWHKDTSLSGYDFVVVPGGFAYGDYLRAGAIARFSPIMKAVSDFAQSGGYVLGICNGFQVLTEAGLLEGALLKNTNQKYICKNIHLRPATQNSVITQRLDLNTSYQIPIAHGEGRYFASSDTIRRLQDEDQILFYYADEEGQITEEANPNGSSLNIAGICNKERNVIGMMPHPERAANPHMKNTDGLLFFESVLNTLASS